MKQKLTILLFILLLSSAGRGKASETQPSKDPAIETLNRFYTQYITEISKTPEDMNQTNLIKQKYCTPQLLKKISELDYDPFINAQDLPEDLLKTLTIKKETGVDNKYTVSYLDTYSQKQITIHLKTIRDKDSCKIAEIL